MMTVLSNDISLLSCSSPIQLADFCALVVPRIWSGVFYPKQPQQQPLQESHSRLDSRRFTILRLFCLRVLKATHISTTCVVLALYYIHGLRTQYPSVQASAGSEIRLFTTALMLANKFLDDNTFTNKTWSEVSNIPVNELNIMEIEFLTALDHRIHVYSHEFDAWVAQCQPWLPAPPTQAPTLPTLPLFAQDGQNKRTSTAIDSELSQRAVKRRSFVPYTPPSDHGLAPTPLYTPVSNYASPLTPSWPYPPCRPILSWSSSSPAAALAATTMHPTGPALYDPFTVAAAAAALVNANCSTSLLAPRVGSLEIE